MADNIINFGEAKEEMETFKIANDDGDLKPMEEWSGEDWERLVEEAMESIGTQMGVSKWDAFAQFMSTILRES